MEAAYRLFANEKVTFTQALQPHIDATERRIAEQAVVILAQPQPAEWIVRACQNRALRREQTANTEDGQDTRHLREAQAHWSRRSRSTF